MSTSRRAPRTASAASAAVAAALAAAAPGAEAWTAPAAPEAVVLIVPAEVGLDRGQVVTLPADGIGLVGDWNADDGSELDLGDPLVVFDNRVPLEAAHEADDDRAIAERTLKLNLAKLDAQLADLAGQELDAEADLATTEAALAAAPSKSQAASDLASAEARLADLTASAAQRAADATRRLVDIGQASVSAAAEGDRSAAVARLLAQLPAAHARLAAAGDPLAQAALALKQRQLMQQIGLRPDGSQDPSAGFHAKIAALKAEQERQRVADELERDRAGDAYHRAIRDALDHTPIISIAIARADGAQARRFCFASAGAAAPAGATAAGLEAYASSRGWGWSLGAPELRATTIAGAAGVAVATHARFRIDVPDGEWRVAVSLGDDDDWYAPSLRLLTARGPERRALYACDHLDAHAATEVQGEVAVAGGYLEVEAGDAHERAIRAPGDGIALGRPWIGPGWRSTWHEDPTAFFADASAITVTARVPIPWVGLLRPAHAPPSGAHLGALAEARERLAIDHVDILAPSGATAAGEVRAIIQTPVVPWRAPPEWGKDSGDPLDFTAYQLEIGVDPAHARSLPIGAAVAVRCTFAIPGGMASVPDQMVVFRDHAAWIQVAGAAPRPVAAMRLADRVVLAQPLAPGTVLVPPLVPTNAGPGRIPGSVIAGRRLPVMLPSTWGRIATLVPEGSRVGKGQVVITLYNPGLESSRHQREQDRRRANQAYLLAQETQHAADVDLANARRQEELAEEQARLGLAQSSLLPQQPIDDAANTLEQQRLEMSASRGEVHGALPLAATDASRATGSKSRLGQAEITLEHRELELAVAQEATDFLAQADAGSTWLGALETLGGREDELKAARLSDRIAASAARLSLTQALAGGWWMTQFERVKDMRAPADGRIFYLNGWNDQTSRVAKFEKDFYVWGGLTVAEVLDMSHLSFQAELPESRWGSLAIGDHVHLRFPQLDDGAIDGRVATLGHVFTRASAALEAGAPVSDLRTVTITIDFRPPAGMADQLVPGTGGVLELP